MTPVYFPGWILDAEVSAEFSYSNVERTASGIIHDSYLPGSDYQVLSWTSNFPKEIDTVDPVPFTKDLEVQHGMEISCLPFTISPFAGLDLAKSMSSRDATIDEDGLRFDPKSLKTNLVAAYPVLFPLYLAQYQSPVPEGQQLVTVFIEAFGHNGRIRAERRDLGKELREIMPGAPQMFIDFTHEMDDVDIANLRGEPSPFFNVAGFLTPERRAIAPAAAEWLNRLIITHEAGPTLVEKSGIITSDDDPRIRPCSFEERTRNMEWMLLSGEMESMKRVVTSMKETHENGRIVHVGSKTATPQDIFDATIKSLQSRIEEIETQRKENTPPWWKEWLDISSKKKSK
ncbi:hypothetical protein DXG03_008610 [Asterophora parasitica]|uniref:Uncharacterized protein n=1 Tax=Asterophora parasitica TaxID=117018 RepID=A0A9P7GC86_9AGAR|nr:hypothetical protein DXG03_008610 [Asterophora parasitica]